MSPLVCCLDDGVRGSLLLASDIIEAGRRRELDESLRTVAPQETLLEADGAAALVIGDGAGVPQEHAARMHDQIRRDRQLDLLDVRVGQAIARGFGCQNAAIEHVEARGGDVALSLEAKSRR